MVPILRIVMYYYYKIVGDLPSRNFSSTCVSVHSCQVLVLKVKLRKKQVIGPTDLYFTVSSGMFSGLIVSTALKT